MLVIPSGSPSGSPSGFNLTRSLRLRASASGYLSRTPSVAGNRKTWTWSGWVKRGALSPDGIVFGAAATVSNATVFRFLPGGALRFVTYDLNTTATQYIDTLALFRDASAWYHVIAVHDTTQAVVANRLKLYVNGTLQSVTLTGSVPQNTDGNVNNTISNQIGNGTLFAWPFDGVMCDINHVDGQALTPSSFGEIDATTGVWKPKKYTGSYGTNGFYLPFTDNSALTTSSNVGLGKDFSGNGNYWTTNNISLTAGATYDSFTDVPTLTSSGAANYCTLNPLVLATIATISNANLQVNSGTGTITRGTIGVSSGKWYWEVARVSGSDAVVGIARSTAASVSLGGDANGYGYIGSNGNKYNNASSVAYGSSYTTAHVIGVELDLDTGTLAFRRDNTSQGTAYSGLSGEFFPAAGSANGADTVVFNFGQRPFAYTPPSGFLALDTFNLPAPTIVQGNRFFNASKFTGTGANVVVTGAGHTPSLVWFKSRSVAENNTLIDDVRGGTKNLVSNLTNAEGTAGAALTFDADGFTVPAGYLTNAATYIGWQWKKGATPGFDVVAFSAPSSGNFTISHSLGVAPKFAIVKDRLAAVNWNVFHASISTDTSKYLTLNSTNATLTAANMWGAALPTSSVLGLNAGVSVSSGVTNGVAYLWSEIAGFSKFGSYVGNGSTDGPFVYCGFRPRYVMAKGTAGGEQWVIWDTARDTTNIVNNGLFANASTAEAGGADADILSNGFKPRRSATNFNASGVTYIYAAFAENPFKYSLAR